MFKKIASIALAATMVAGTSAISASAAEADSSSEVGANASSEVSAKASSETGSGKVFKFDVKSLGWDKAAAGSTVFCHIYSIDGTGKFPGWQSKGEKCTYDAASGVATYDIQTGVKKGFTGLNELDANNKWAIIFSLGTGAETYPILVNSNCFGDTVYSPDKTKKYENNVDSEKSSIAVKWKNNNLGPAKCITSTGKIQGDDYAYGENENTTMASFLCSYALDTKKVNKDNVQKLFNEINASVLDTYAIFKDKESKDSNKDADTKAKDKKAVVGVLTQITDPKTNKTYTEAELEGAKAPASNSSSGSSSGSSSVKSGQESTIFFVFGGLMLAAAGVMFLARKRRQF